MEEEFSLPFFIQKPLAYLDLQALLNLSLLFSILWIVAFQLGLSIRGFDVNYLLLVGSLGLLFSWRLASSRTAGWKAGLLMAGVGLVGAVLLPGRLVLPLLRAVGTLGDFLLGIWRWQNIDNYPPPNWGPVQAAGQELGQAAGTLMVRFTQWVGLLVEGKGSLDPLVMVLIWSLLFWGFGTWAGWHVRRLQQPLLAVLPQGALLAGVLNYTHSSPGLLIMFLAVAFSLIVLVNQRSREKGWDDQDMDFSTEIRFDLVVSAAPVILLILVAASMVPSFSIKRIMEFASTQRQAQAERFEQVGESLGITPPQRKASTLPSDLFSSGLPRQHLIGSGPELSELGVMMVATGELAPGPPEAFVGRTIPRHYWRSLTYDLYTGRGWAVGRAPAVIEYEAGRLARQPGEYDDHGEWILPDDYRLLSLAFEILKEDENLVYSDGTLISVDQDYMVGWRGTTDTYTGEPGGGDIFAATVETPDYFVQSMQPDVSLARLNRAGRDYPEWVTSHYLSLPENLPQRVRSLALDITANAATPYERARAIEQYLRQIPYTLNVSRPPNDRDVVDYYLFDLQMGYCDYSATAMVVLSRAAGLPARLVMGYASGSYDTYSARYRVSEADAHSWAEVYFPGVGWVEFEPTGGQPEINRPDQVNLTASQEPYQTMWQPQRAQPARPDFFRLAGFAAAILAAGVLALATFDTWYLLHMEPGRAIEHLYKRLVRHGRRMAVQSGQPFLPGSTPAEFAGALNGRITQVARGPLFKAVVLASLPEVTALTASYTQAAYSPRAPGDAERRQALAVWRKLSWRLWLAGRLQRLKRSGRGNRKTRQKPSLLY